MNEANNQKPEWVDKGKTISQLIKELQTFEDQSLRVHLSFDSGYTCLPISLIGKKGDKCLLMYIDK